MHMQVVNFNLEGITHDDYLQIAETAAPAFAELPGLISKVWLCDKARNTYGGIYTWSSKEAMDTYATGELFTGAVKNNPNFVNLTGTDFGVLEGPSEVTGIAPLP